MRFQAFVDDPKLMIRARSRFRVNAHWENKIMDGLFAVKFSVSFRAKKLFKSL